MPRPRNPEATAVWKISVPVTVAASISHLLHDRLAGKPAYGLRSRLVTALLREYLAKHPVDLATPGALDEQEVERLEARVDHLVEELAQ